MGTAANWHPRFGQVILKTPRCRPTPGQKRWIMRCNCHHGAMLAAWMVASWMSVGAAADLLVGTAVTSITHDRPIALQGQMHTRIGSTVDTPLEASAVALAARQAEQSL